MSFRRRRKPAWDSRKEWTRREAGRRCTKLFLRRVSLLEKIFGIERLPGHIMDCVNRRTLTYPINHFVPWHWR